MAEGDDAVLTAEHRINKLFRTALLLDASLVWESSQWPQVSLRRETFSRTVDMAPLPRKEMDSLLRAVMDDRQWSDLQQTGAAEFSHTPDAAGPGLRVSVSANGNRLRVAARPLQWDDPDTASVRVG
jgi:hypothetical protein